MIINIVCFKEYKIRQPLSGCNKKRNNDWSGTYQVMSCVDWLISTSNTCIIAARSATVVSRLRKRFAILYLFN